MDTAEKKDAGQHGRQIGRFLWLKIFLSGLAMFFLLNRAFMATGNINYIPSLLVVGTFTVPLSFVIFLYSRDKTPGVSVGDVLVSAVWGGVMGTVLAGVIEYHALMDFGLLSTLLVGLIEEVVKLAVPVLLIFDNKKRSEIDAIIIGAAAGAGFAALESMGYGLVSLLVTGGNVTETTTVLMVRALMAPAAHIAWTALAADALWRLRQNTPHAAGQFFAVLLGVVLLHAAWDSTTPLGGFMFVVVGLISLGWLAVRIRKATRPPNPDIANLLGWPML